jgi:hypothetical protein
MGRRRKGATFMNGRFTKHRTLLNAMLFCSVLLRVALFTQAAFAGTLDGTVKNGTNGKLATGTDVILIQLQGGMQPVANTKTDAQGHYHFDNPQLGTGPMLVRVVYKGVNYHEPITPGKTTADVEVFEPTDKPDAFSVANHAIILQPNGSELMVGEEYMIANKTQPPVAFYRADGSFNFTVPDGADFNQAAAWGTSGMPVVQGTIDKGKNKMAIAFPFRPGESGVRLSYKMPYAGNHLMLRNVSPYATERLIIAAPPTVQISGSGISPAGQDQGFNVYMRDNVAANSPIDVSVSGAAPLPASNQGARAGGGAAGAAASADDSQNASVNSRADAGGAEAPSVSATTIPARLDGLKWILTGGFASLFVLGFAYLWLRPRSVVASNGTAAITDVDASQSRSAKKSAARASSARAAIDQPPVSSAVPAKAAEAAAAIDNEVRGSLDELKDSIFRLELRRQAGTVSEEDYVRERERVEKTLRGLVRG